MTQVPAACELVGTKQDSEVPSLQAAGDEGTALHVWCLLYARGFQHDQMNVHEPKAG